LCVVGATGFGVDLGAEPGRIVGTDRNFVEMFARCGRVADDQLGGNVRGTVDRIEELISGIGENAPGEEVVIRRPRLRLTRT
jgi:hypothetical protein